jgi:hypothetical protein
VRGLDETLPGPPGLTWSDPAAVQIVPATYQVVPNTTAALRSKKRR